MFSLFLFIWGIKEISLSSKSDERFARCKKTCGFAMFLKFMFFAYTVALVVLPFALEGFTFVTLILNLAMQVENFYLYLTAGLAVIALLMFLLPTINFAVAAKKFKNQGGEFVSQEVSPENNTNQVSPQQQGQFYQEQPRSTMQANMPPLPNYRPQQPMPNTVNPQQQVSQPQVVNTAAAGPDGLPQYPDSVPR